MNLGTCPLCWDHYDVCRCIKEDLDKYFKEHSIPMDIKTIGDSYSYTLADIRRDSKIVKITP